MPKLVDEVGNRYGRLLVIKRCSENAANGHARWACGCDCGAEAVIHGDDLRAGKVTSCGCLRTEKLVKRNVGRRLPNSQASFNVLYGKYKYAAGRRGLAFGLTKEDFGFLTKMNCFYCGVPPSKAFRALTSPGTYTYNGIDRIDNEQGYTLDNVAPCCEACNKMKRASTVEEFKEHILAIVRYRGWGE